MNRRTLIFASLIVLFSLYIKLATDNQMLSLYGNNKGYGVDCLLIDVKFKLHVYHIRKRDMGYGVHGCPVFVDRRMS